MMKEEKKGKDVEGEKWPKEKGEEEEESKKKMKRRYTEKKRGMRHSKADWKIFSIMSQVSENSKYWNFPFRNI